MSTPTRPARRRFVTLAASAPAALGALPAIAVAQRKSAPERPPLIKPRRLRPGDTIGLVSPSGATFERSAFEHTIESIQALGFKVREAPNLRARYGHLAGTDRQRADDINAMFADDSVHGILAMTGGSGGNRILPLVDYEAMRRKPKFLGGFSDLTALINAVHARTGLVTFHAPVGNSEWNEFSVRHLRAAAIDAEAMLLTNPRDKEDQLVPKGGRTTTLRGGRARGPILGGNLAVLTSIAGSPYWPQWDGAILFIEDINEWIYRVDRMVSTLALAGVLERVAGIVIGAFTKCEPGDGYGALTLEEVWDDHFVKPLKVPVYSGASIGHIKRKFTVPVGLPVEMDADAGTIRFLEPAVL
jgi:muramoyltetrapeptide carboxypeptidase